MHNRQFSFMFREIASLLELQGDDPFRIRAYRRAAQSIENLGESLRNIARRDGLEEIPGIGKTLAKEIQELLEMGQLRYHEHLKSTVPSGLLPLLHLPSLTSEHIRTLWRTYDVTSMSQLIQVRHDDRLALAPPTLEALDIDIAAWQREQHRVLLGMALPRAEILVQNLARLPLVERISLAGSLRRGVDMVADINIVMASPDPPRLIHLCNQQPEVHEVLETETVFTRLITSEGLHLSLVAVPPQHFAATLVYHTGSTAHLTALQRVAQQRRLLLSEHGLVHIKGRKPLAVATEEAIYQHLGLPYIAPELRQDRGEIEAAEAGNLPHLVAKRDVLGDLHMHSDWGTGSHGLEDIARAAQRMGYQYVAMCDYASASGSGRGLTPATLTKQIATIRQLNATLPDTFQLLAGAEVEISPEGELEIEEAVLQELDMVIAAIHSGFKEPRHKITRRLCKAMEHPLVHILAHPANRMLGRTTAPSIDIEAVLETAVETHTCLEINSHVLRLDLPDIYVRQGRDLGITFSLGSDAHTIQEMGTMRLGITTARRGWLEARQLLNTLPLRRLLERLRHQDVSNVT